MDGLLIDSEPLWREVERAVFGGLGIHVTDRDFEETMGVRINEVVALWRSRHPWCRGRKPRFALGPARP